MFHLSTTGSTVLGAGGLALVAAAAAALRAARRAAPLGPGRWDEEGSWHPGRPLAGGRHGR